MRKDNGFTFTESLAAFSIVMMLVMTVLPLLANITIEEALLGDRREVSSKLHDELQALIWEKPLPAKQSISKKIDGNPVEFSFHQEKDRIKACANWENRKQRSEEVCLYGYKER